MPGSHIPILAPEHLIDSEPDYVLILPWNISKEIIMQNVILKEKGTQFLIAVPKLKVL